MPLDNITLSQIVNPTSVNPGSAGWDAAVRQFHKDRSGRMGFQLLSRIEAIQPENDSDGSVVMLCPPGFVCVPMFCNVFLRGGTVGSPQYYEFFRGAKSAANIWAGLNAGGGSNYINFSKLTLTESLLVWARPEASLFTDLVPEAIPFLDGDDSNLNTLSVRRQSGNVLTLGLHFYGVIFPKSDS